MWKGGEEDRAILQTRFDRLFTGIAVPIPDYMKEGDTRGKENITREDTGEADYEKLLGGKGKQIL